MYASGPDEFINYVKNIRSVEKSLIYRVNKISNKEKITKLRARRGLYLKKPLKKGEKIDISNVVELRPANNLNPIDKIMLTDMIAGEDINEFQSLKIYNSKLYCDSDFSWDHANDYWIRQLEVV